MRKVLLLLIASFLICACTCTSVMDTPNNSGNKPTEKLNTPIITPSNLEIDDETDISIKFDDGAECYYTIDGKNPDRVDGIKYTGAFRLSKSATIRVGVFKSGCESVYTQKIYRVVPKSTDTTAYLDGLSISGIANLNFDKTKQMYEFNVGNETQEVTVYPSTEFGEITVNGAKCESGNSIKMPLNIGANTVLIVVSNAGLTKNYIIKIVRQSENPSNNANLSSLTVKNCTLNPAFSAAVTKYTANVAYDVVSLALSYTKEDDKAVATVNMQNTNDIPLSIGENKVVVTVIAEDGETTKNYIVNIYRAAKAVDDVKCELTSVTVNGINVPVKSEMDVEVDTSDVNIAVTSANTADKVTIGETEGTEAAFTNLIGENLLEIKVDSGNGVFKIYTLKVTVVKKSNAALTSVKVGSSSIGTIQSNMGLNVKEKNVTVTVEANEHAKSVMIDGVETKTASVTVAAADATFGNKSVKIILTDNEGNPVTYYLTLTYQETVTGKIIVHAYGYPYIYYWTTSADAKVEAMTDEGEDWYTFTINETEKNIIFRKKGGSDWEGKTPDLSRTEGEWWYKDGKWSAYPEDKVPPTVSIVTPAAGSTVSGDAVTVEAEANDDREMAYVDFYVDGKKAKTVKALPYSFQWNSTYVKNGTHTLKAVAYDASGNSASTEEITVTATNSNLAPEAVIGGSKRVPVSITKNYRGTSSKDLNGEIVSYKWSITGGATLDSDSASSVNITFPAAVSTYTLTLTVTDDLGATDTTSMDIETYVKSQTKWDFREETIYFAMTTRFYDGDKSNNVHCWDENAATPEDDPAWRGDFKGLIEKLDYIKALGFTAVWITPVVENCSGMDYHGYHAMDFRKVDPRYESDDVDFQTLIDEVHARDMKIVLDVVLNHTGNFGENFLAPMFVKDYVNGDHEDINSILQPHPNTLLDWDTYVAAPGPQQYAMRLDSMKNTDYQNHDIHNYYHHFGFGNWDNFSVQFFQMAGDCVDLNTENPKVLEYIGDSYAQYIEMGVDAFRIDTGKHLSRLEFNYYFNERFMEAASSVGNDNFFMFTEICAKSSDVTYRGNVENLSPYFYTWKDEHDYGFTMDDRDQFEGVIIYPESAETEKDEQAVLSNLSYWTRPTVDGGTKTPVNALAVQKQGMDTHNVRSNRPESDNHLLKGNEYHKPDYSMRSGLDVIDFPMHWNFGSASGAFSVKSGDKYYNDATWNVVYVDSHDYGPGNQYEQRYDGELIDWAENTSLMFTFRGIPCLYYGSEVGFMKGAIIDKGPIMPLCETGRAYFGDYLEGSVTATGFGEYTASGAVADTLNNELAQHIIRLNKIRRAVPALQKGQYSTDGCSGSMAFKRRYTDEYEDSFVLVTISGSSTFTGLPGGTYVDCITGDSQTIGEGGSITATCSGKGNMRVYVLDTAKSPAPGKIGNATEWLK